MGKIMWVIISLLVPSTAVAEFPPINDENLVLETHVLVSLYIQDPTCQEIFKTVTGELPQEIYTTDRMKLFWDFSEIIPAFVSPSAIAITYRGPLIPVPRVIMFHERLKYFGAMVATHTFLHELVHVSMFENPLCPKQEEKEEKLADKVANRCMGVSE
jgi:hypothetical protein